MAADVCSNRNANAGAVDIYDKAATGFGDERLLLKDEFAKFPTSWSHDGQNILYTAWSRVNSEIWMVSLSANAKATPLIQSSAFSCDFGQFSPDQHYIAYVANEAGHPEVYVQTFPLSGGHWQISSGGGWAPLWRSDGKELCRQLMGGSWRRNLCRRKV
jgi:Tol biopolymer transport system component